jgi:catechol 2,3-dioxygenase-like lactoylglutathione lyase family enzyme
MLEGFDFTPTIPCADLERAKKFYADKLGLTPKEERMDGILYVSGGTQFLLYPTQFTGAQHTLGGFDVKDIEKTMKELRGRGVTFEEYDFPGLKTENGIAKFGDSDRGAWFKDSEGNILAVVERH